MALHVVARNLALCASGPAPAGLQSVHDAAWYWRLRFKEVQLWQVALISWGLAFVEYRLAVPANRWGATVYSPAQLKTIQEVVTLVIFAGFSWLYLHQPLAWNHALGFGFIALGTFFIFHRW